MDSATDFFSDGPVGSVPAMAVPSLNSLLTQSAMFASSPVADPSVLDPSIPVAGSPPPPLAHPQHAELPAMGQPRRKRRAAAQAEAAINQMSSPRTRRRSVPSVAAAATTASLLEGPHERPPKRTRRNRVHAKKKPPPNAKNDADYEDDKCAKGEEEKAGQSTTKAGEETESCVICMSVPDQKDLASIDACEHTFCFDCVEQWSRRENKCPLCKARFSQINRVHKSKKRGKNGRAQANSKRVKTRDQRSDLISGTAIEAMLSGFTSNNQFFAPEFFLSRFFEGTNVAGIRTNRTNRRHNPSARARGARAMSAFSTENSTTDSDDESHESVGPNFQDAMRHAMALNRERGLRAVASSSSRSSSTSATSSRAPSAARAVTLSFPDFFQAQSQAATASAPARSYAANSDDTNAGSNFHNPLEIEDDSDEDEVEIIEPPVPPS